LLRPTLQAVAPSWLNDAAKLPTCTPKDAITAPDDVTPRLGLLSTALDDVHAVASHPLPAVTSPTLGSLIPVLLPSTVTLAAPVAAPLRRTPLLASGLSYVIAEERLPVATARLLITVREAETPGASLPPMADDDVHVVESLLLPPSRLKLLQSHAPTLPPRTVTLAAPVAPALVRTMPLTATTSSVAAFVRLLNCSPAVTVTTRSPTLPANLHTTADDDPHAVVSIWLPPTRCDVLESKVPAPDPSTVTLAEPVAPTLPTTLLDGRRLSYETDSTLLPVSISNVADIECRAETPDAALQNSDVDDCHADERAPVPPTRSSTL
jgi:hypothetical protein